MKFQEFMAKENTADLAASVPQVAPQTSPVGGYQGAADANPLMTQSISAKVDQLLKMLNAKNPMQIQQIRDELNSRLQGLQSDKGWGQRAANLSYRNASQARRDV